MWTRAWSGSGLRSGSGFAAGLRGLGLGAESGLGASSNWCIAWCAAHVLDIARVPLTQCNNCFGSKLGFRFQFEFAFGLGFGRFERG